MTPISTPYLAHKLNPIYLTYNRLRIGFGAPLGFVLMYGAYTNNFNNSLIWIGIGFFCLEVFGALYNDYWDYEDDIRNHRSDKLTATGLLKKEQIQVIAYMFLFLGLAVLLPTNNLIALVSIYYAAVQWGYAHPRIPLRRNLATYFGGGTIWFIVPVSLVLFFDKGMDMSSICFALFCYFQYVYILCQKDSTDSSDETNLFKILGWKNASRVCAFTALIALFFLFTISYHQIGLVVIGLVNAFSKAYNLDNIQNRRIVREIRRRCISIEFLTPYMYLGGVTIGY